MEPSTAPTPAPGLPARIGRYQVRRLVGEGAMGRVLLAHDPVLDRDVAVKHLRTDLHIPSEVRDGLVTRMRHEARAAARVAHPNIVVLHDMGEDEEIGLYLVFEYVEGPTLKQRIEGGRLPPDEVARLARDLGEALSIAHEAGILHRDIKPENVILAKKGGKIADFGIARIPDSTLTHQGGLMGTPAYSAPETFRAGTFSPASDQFSLAATLYEALSGKRAYPGEDAALVAAKIATDAPAPCAGGLGLPPAVDEVFVRATAKTVEERFASCLEFGEALAASLSPLAGGVTVGPRAALVAKDPGAPRAAVPEKSPPPDRKTEQVVLGALVVVVTAGLLLRTALRSVDGDVQEPTVVPVPTHVAPTASVRPRASAPLPRPFRPPPAASPAITASPIEALDAGAEGDAGPARAGQIDPAASSAHPSAPSAVPSAAPPAASAGRPDAGPAVKNDASAP